MIGAPDAAAIPRDSGRATRKTTREAGTSAPRLERNRLDLFRGVPGGLWLEAAEVEGPGVMGFPLLSGRIHSTVSNPSRVVTLKVTDVTKVVTGCTVPNKGAAEDVG
jgi:hypothetical protein